MTAPATGAELRQICNGSGTQGLGKNAEFVHIGPSLVALPVIGGQSLGVNADLVQPPAEMKLPEAVADLPAVHVKAESFQFMPGKGQMEPATGNDSGIDSGIRLQELGVPVIEP